MLQSAGALREAGLYNSNFHKMSKQDFELLKAEIEAIPDEEILTPNMPVSEAVQEAENLAAWCVDDKPLLEKAGLDWALVVGLPIRAGACRFAQSVWVKESQTREDAQQEWKDRSPAAFDLRDELLHDFEYAFRDRPDLLVKVKAIREGNSNADMLQDLSDIKVLGDENSDLLVAAGVDLAKLETAENTADELSTVLALANEEGGEDGIDKKIRDKAYTYMKWAVDEIRECGQYVFWRNKDRKKGYVSAYFRRKNRG